MESLLATIEIKIWSEHTDYIIDIWFLSITMIALVITAYTIHRGSMDDYWILLPLFSLIS